MLQLVDLPAARIEAARLLGAMITHEPENFWQAKVWRLAVEDIDGLGLFQLHASAVEAPDTGHRPAVERI